MNSRVTLVAALCAATSGAAQVPLSVDTSFRLDVNARNAFSLAFKPDGDVLVSGLFEFPDEFPNGIYERSLLSLDSDGGIDLAFPCCPGGATLTPWMDRWYVGVGITVRRLMPDGTLDPSFQHMNNDPYFSSGNGSEYHVFDDGRVLLTGLHSISAPQLGFDGLYNLVWFFANGRLDTTRTHRTGNGINWAIKEYATGTAGGLEGKFLVDTWGTTYEGQPVDKVFRIHADGALDTTFRSHIEWGYVWEIEPLPDGRAYLGGAFRMEGGGDTLCVIRVMPDGSLDPTFNNALRFRKRPEATANYPGVTCVYPIAPGLLALTGSFSEVDDVARESICMIDTTGQLVQACFDGAGCGSYQYFTSVYGTIAGIAEAPSGDYYIWGAYHGYTDGTTNDTLQRMVTRLHGGEIGLGIPAPGQQQELLMRLYPNPASTSVTVDLAEAPTDAVITVFDALGCAVLRRRLPTSSALLDLSGLGVGIYALEYSAQGAQRSVQRLVVQR